MNILYISHLHPPQGALLENLGGMQRVSMQLSDALAALPQVQVHKHTLEARWDSIAWSTAKFLTRLAVELPVWVQQTGADVVLFSSMVTASLAPVLRSRVAVPMVTINHGQDVTLPVQPYQMVLPFIFSKLDGVISVSQATREQSILRGSSPATSIALPNAIPDEWLHVEGGKAEARSTLAAMLGKDLSQKQVLLSVGRQVKRKGHAWFIREVMPKLSDSVEYVLIGDGPEAPVIQHMIQQTGLQHRVHLLGKQPDEVVRAAYSGADLFIMPNIVVPGDMEGFGVVLIEANAAGMPAVASDLEGIKDVIFDGENGYKVPVEDAEAFAACIQKVLDSELNELSQKSKTFVKTHFAWNAVVQRYLAYLSQVVQHHRNKPT